MNLRPGGDPLLILVRHGRTALNADDRLRGHLDPPLDEVGHTQAATVAAALVPYGPARILSSPLLRARQTASSIADLVGLQVELDARLLDRDYGSWAGQRRRDVVARWGSVDGAPGVEHIRHVHRRASDIVYEHPLRVPTVLVTHDAVLHAMLTAIGAGCAPDAIEPADWFTLVPDGSDLLVGKHGHG